MILEEQTHRGANTGSFRDIAICLFLMEDKKEVVFILIWQTYADNLSW